MDAEGGGAGVEKQWGKRGEWAARGGVKRGVALGGKVVCVTLHTHVFTKLCVSLAMCFIGLDIM